MNARLTAPFSSEEIKKAVFSMHPSKALGLDGMTAFFFQTYWDVIGQDVYRVVMDFFEGERMLRAANHTLISLISKVKKVIIMKDLRPIGLCNILYKITAKILTLRIQPFMNGLVIPG